MESNDAEITRQQKNSNPKVAFIVHPTDRALFREYINFLKPGKKINDSLLIKLFEWMPSYLVKQWHNLSFGDSRCVDAQLIFVPFLPEMKDIKLAVISAKIEQAIALAAAQKCQVASLGAFTSILIQGKEKQFEQRYGMALTSGNTLTAAVIVRSITEICRRFDRPLSTQTVAVIGASGDIGSGCCSYFGTRVRKLILTARGMVSLQQCVKSIGHNLACPVELTLDNSAALKSSDIVIFVTSSPTSLFTMEIFNPATIVVDASTPLNVVCDRPRPDVFYYHGGIVKIPFSLDVGFNIGLPAPDTFYSCQIESMLIALHGLPCSAGRGSITVEHIERYLRHLDRQPAISCLYSFLDHEYTPGEIAAIAARFSRGKHTLSQAFHA
ncbi:MAG: hypothetical protein JW795_10980 [Chitinivibrionales bacterium]|nr:hypothetical protein [Chitinivibrionales bacterium]